ncbi:MAG: Homocysteine S-methyltransferase family protein [Ignavibacteria bacterium]|nr:MAG: Homocysteine S-methyltransferase family protein [Ignavibacteria bacterium]KAF0162062.1 MAG: Homocysteine S-methyltransferase family protein [Ignavibacteria bacterium]
MRNQYQLIQNRIKNKKPLLLNGAIGTYLSELGFEPDKHLWFSHLNILNPEAIVELHNEYIEAGADIITTNTFRTNPAAKKKSNLAITNAELVKKSVKLALQAKGDSEIIIAGSNAPAEDCYQRERTISAFALEYNHKKHIELLYESGCDIILNETQSHLDELDVICKFCTNNSIPYSISLYFDDSLHILSGHTLEETIELVSSYSPQSIGFNCIKIDYLKCFLYKYYFPHNFGFYLNCAESSVTYPEMNCKITPQNYLDLVKEYITDDLLFIGSCCGSSPRHTKLLREHVDEIYRN